MANTAHCIHPCISKCCTRECGSSALCAYGAYEVLSTTAAHAIYAWVPEYSKFEICLSRGVSSRRTSVCPQWWRPHAGSEPRAWSGAHWRQRSVDWSLSCRQSVTSTLTVHSPVVDKSYCWDWTENEYTCTCTYSSTPICTWSSEISVNAQGNADVQRWLF